MIVYCECAMILVNPNINIHPRKKHVITSVEIHKLLEIRKVNVM